MELLTLDKVVAILTLTLMEIVLGIDNIVFFRSFPVNFPKIDKIKQEISVSPWLWDLESACYSQSVGSHP